jgi:hypothetical protein
VLLPPPEKVQCPNPAPNADFYIDPGCSTPYTGNGVIGGLSDAGSGEAGTDASPGDDGPCIPPPSSCDAPPPQVSPLDPQRGCLAAPVPLTGVCDTSVNRCTPSAGLGPLCAFAPDGGIFVTIISDNETLTAAGWQFTETGIPIPIPAGQRATAAEEDECKKALCTPPCSGAHPLALDFVCPPDGEDAGGD